MCSCSCITAYVAGCRVRGRDAEASGLKPGKIVLQSHSQFLGKLLGDVPFLGDRGLVGRPKPEYIISRYLDGELVE